MKRIALIIAVLCLFLPALALAMPEENVENIKAKNIEKAGVELLKNAENHLNKIKDVIENYVREMPNDNIISLEEMRELRMIMNNFFLAKQEEDARLDFYKLKTSTAIPEEIKNLTKVYFSTGSPFFGDNAAQEIKKYFVEKTGEDIVVEQTTKTVRVIILIFFIGCVIIICVGFFLKFK